MKLIAQKEFAYPFIGGRHLKVGDSFEAQPQLAKTLILTRLAIEAPQPPPREKRKYKRRDMSAEGREMTAEDALQRVQENYRAGGGYGSVEDD